MISTTHISRADLKSKIDAQTSFALVDALSADLFAKSHLPGAINIPYDGPIRTLAAKLLPNKDAEIVTYCMKPT